MGTKTENCDGHSWFSIFTIFPIKTQYLMQKKIKTDVNPLEVPFDFV